MIRQTLEEMESFSGDKFIIDIRNEEAFDRESYPGSVNIFLEDFMERFKEKFSPLEQEELKKKTIYLICYTGIESDYIAEDMQALGYECYSLEGGYRSITKRNVLRYLNEDITLTPKKEEEYVKSVEKSIIKKFRKDIWRKFTKAINDYHLIQDGDCIAVCISGGKDSMLMAKLFQELLKHGKQNFTVKFLVMNPGYNDINYQVIMDNAKKLHIPVEVFKTEIFDTVAVAGGNPCYLCARMRRGYLYSQAKEMGCNKIALGHHYDDVIETILMSMLYSGRIQTMMPKLHSSNFEGMELIRPMYYIRESSIIKWRDYNNLYFIQCACRFTESCASCGGTERGSKRADVKRLIASLEKEEPLIAKNIFRSAENVDLGAMIGYKYKGEYHNFLDEY